MKKLSLIVAFIMIFSGIIIIIPSENISAGTDYWWIGTTTDSALNTNWNPATVPSNGGNIYFSAMSMGSCLWTLTGSYGSFNLLANFSYTVTQGASFSITSYSQTAGTFTGSTSYVLTCLGSFLHSAGTITNNVLQLIMNSHGASFTMASGWVLNQLRAQDDCIATRSDSLNIRIMNIVTDAGKAITIPNTKVIEWKANLGTLSNAGSIDGTGTFRAYCFDADYTVAFGAINAPCEVMLDGSAIASHICTLIDSATFGSTFWIYSSHATNTITFDLSATNYALSATDIMIGTRGILKGRASQINCSGNFDSNAGSYLPESSSLHLAGISKTLKTGTERITNLFIESGASYTLQSNLYAVNLWNNGTLNKAGYTVYVNNDQAPVITSSAITSCHFIDDYYYNVTYTDREMISNTFGLTSIWPNVAINTTTGKITNVAPLANGTWTLSVSITNGTHIVYQNFSLNIWNYNPVINSRAYYVATIFENYFYLVNATDSEGYSITFNCTFSGTWLVWNPSNHSLSGQPFTKEIGYYTVSISAWDGYKTTWENFTIQVEGPLTTMTMTFLIYFVFQIILLTLGLIGYFKLPFLLFIEVIGTISIAFQSISAFENYWIFALILIITNISIPAIGLTRKR